MAVVIWKCKNGSCQEVGVIKDGSGQEIDDIEGWQWLENGRM